MLLARQPHERNETVIVNSSIHKAIRRQNNTLHNVLYTGFPDKVASLAKDHRHQDLPYIYILAGVAYAIATELIQHFFIFMRSGDILDFASDSIGMALSILIFPFYPKFIRWIFG